MLFLYNTVYHQHCAFRVTGKISQVPSTYDAIQENPTYVSCEVIQRELKGALSEQTSYLHILVLII